MLEFTSEQHFLSTVDSLNNLRETHIDNFMRNYENADDEYIFKVYEDTGFDDDLPLKQFETSMNFSSMRQAYQSLMDVWLSYDSLDMSTYPADIYVFTLAEMTLLNPNGEVKIADRLIKLTREGYVDIADNDIATLIAINNGDLSAYSAPTVTTNIDFNNTQNLGASCKMYPSKTFEHKWSDKKVIMKMCFQTFPWYARSKAEASSFKKKNNGNWKGFSRNFGISLQSSMYASDCTTLLAMEHVPYQVKKRKSYSKTHTRWGYGFSMRAKNNSTIYGYFTFGGISRTKFLEW